MSRVAIYGAGAIGSLLGARLHLAGNDVSLIARGPHLDAIRAHGLRLVVGKETEVCRLPAFDDPKLAGEHDYIILSVKAPALSEIAPNLAPLMGSGCTVVTAMNGIPYWYFYGIESAIGEARLDTVDPGGKIWDAIPPKNVIGCVVYPAAEVVEPGVVRHIGGNRFSLGEPTGERTPRLLGLSALLEETGLEAPVRRHIRNDIWVKLWGNVAFNPVSVLTGATLEDIADHTEGRAIVRQMMAEAQEIAEALGVRLGVDIERRIDAAAELGAHKTSMLQDIERGRPAEVDAMISVVQELGRRLRIATPTLDVVLALTKIRAGISGSYPLKSASIESDGVNHGVGAANE